LRKLKFKSEIPVQRSAKEKHMTMTDSTIQSKFPPLSLSICIAFVATVLAFACAPAFSQTSGVMVAIPDNTPVSLQDARLIAHSDPDAMLEIAVGLRLQHEQELDALIDRLHDPNSPDYGRFITPTDFVNGFAPTQGDADTVKAYLESQGLTVLQVTPNRMLIQARGTVSQLEQTFQVRINDYRVQGEKHFSNDRNPSVPAAMSEIVRSVSGLSSLENSHPLISASTSPPAVIFTPMQIATAYNYPNSLNSHREGHSYDGSGVAIAIATAFTYEPSDVNTFWQYLGIERAGSITTIPVNGGSTLSGYETTLDIEQAGAQAPGANLLVYTVEGDASTGTASNVSFELMFTQIVTDNLASIVSHSWGNCEKNYGNAQMQSDDAIFKQGAVQGISFFVASGDSGAYDCGGSDASLSVDSPASDPYVAAVGGTSLILNSKGTRSSESAWTGSGGGVSQVFHRPFWEFGRTVPRSDWRGVPDVALDAAVSTPYYSFFQGQWGYQGGTSFAAPNWAALWALGLQARDGRRVGLPTPYFYLLGDSRDYHEFFFDITSGNNGDGVGPGYDAKVGWDYTTGWGTPDGAQLVNLFREY
jgi:subtilase family serine protease